MLRLSNLADYGVVIMAAVARTTADRNPVSAAQIADATGIPVPTVAKLLGQLARQGLLSSQRGVAGGFSLSADASRISLADIVEAIDGPISLTHCGDVGEHCCELAATCEVRPHWQPVNRAVRNALQAVALAELIPEAQKIPA